MKLVTDDRVILAAVLTLFAVCVLQWVALVHTGQDRDGWRARVDGLNVQMIRGCTAHPDGPGECRAGVFPTTTTIAVP